MWSTALAQGLCLSAYPFLQQLIAIRIEIFVCFPTAIAKESNAMMLDMCRDTPCLLFPLHLLCLLISSELAVVYKYHLRLSSLKYIAMSNSPNIWMLERKGGCYSIASVSMFPLPFLPFLRQVFEITRILAVSRDNPLTHRSFCSHPGALTKKPNQHMLLQNQGPPPPCTIIMLRTSSDQLCGLLGLCMRLPSPGKGKGRTQVAPGMKQGCRLKEVTHT